MKTEKEITALFTYCGIQVRKVWEIKNQYWPTAYEDMIRENPWWLVLTPCGIVEIGPRKKVISVSWETTTLRYEVPEAKEKQVTCSETLFHAWDEGQLIVFLKSIASHFSSQPYIP